MAGSRQSSVSVALLRHLKHYAEGLGVGFGPLCDAAGVDIENLGDGRRRVSGRQFNRIWEQLVAAGDDPHPGLSFGLEVGKGYPAGSLLFTMMGNCPTLGRALDVFIRYHRIMADAIQPRMEGRGDALHLFWEGAPEGAEGHPDLSEALLCIYYTILTHLTRGRLKPMVVCFSHPGPRDTGLYLQTFEAPVRFEAPRDELIISSEALALEIHLADGELFDLLERHAVRLVDTMEGERRWTRAVMQQIQEMLLAGIRPEIDTVSKALALSRRNLQAKLKMEATTYRNCLDTVRKRMALELLARPDLALSEVAFLLGYSEQSAFNHAFKRWTGKRPKALR